MKISFFEVSDPEEIRFITSFLKGHKLRFFSEPINEVAVSKFSDSEIISTFIYSRVNSQILSVLPNLRAVLTRSTGFDHIDLKICKKRNIQVGNVPNYGENTVAEHTFALLLNISRKVHKSYNRVSNRDYSITGLEGFDLSGKVIGIIGVGNIGMHVIRIARGFGMKVLAYDLKEDKFLSDLLHFEYADVDSILRKADVISLHLPYNKNTHHFLDRARLLKMKRSAVILNTARGGLVDTYELYKMMKRGRFLGAGLDVIEGEENLSKEAHARNFSKIAGKKVVSDWLDDFLHMDNVIFTPHNAFNSFEARRRILSVSISNIEDFIKLGSVRFSVLK